MSEVKLLPCPFCGGEKINVVDAIEEYQPNIYIYNKYLQCDCCANRSLSVISSKPITEHGIEVLIEKWNTRKPIDRIVEQLEEQKGDENDYTNAEGKKLVRHWNNCVDVCKEIVNQLTEEYKPYINDNDLMIVESLPSLYPMKEFEEEALQRVIGCAKKEYNNCWIPCSDRLPEKSGLYLITCKNGVVKLASYDTDFEEFFDVYSDTFNTTVAWQPLPEPYKEDV